MQLTILSYLASLSYLSLGETEIGCQLGSLGQSQVLRPLESSFKLLDLQGRVDCPRLPHLFPLTVHSAYLAVLYSLF